MLPSTQAKYMQQLHQLVAVALFCLAISLPATSQVQRIDSARFFLDTTPLEITLASDFTRLQRNKATSEYQPATITIKFSAQDSVSGEVQIRTRGALRKDICSTPPLMVKFNSGGSPELASLGSLKLVVGCDPKKHDEQLVLKEYLTYKIFNLFTDMSFRVRLALVHYVDTHHKHEPYTQYAFFIEDIDDLARRNNCKNVKGNFNTEATNRAQMTLVAQFQYMIGNVDYAVSINQNTRLIRSRSDSLSAPYVIPYDFDYCGLVNADYAVPLPEYTDVISVTDRKYLGFPRSMDELEVVFELFRNNHADIDSLIQQQEGLTPQNKKWMTGYINEYYNIIKDRKEAKRIFINNARRQ